MVRSWKSNGQRSGDRAMEKDNTWVWTMGTTGPEWTDRKKEARRCKHRQKHQCCNGVKEMAKKYSIFPTERIQQSHKVRLCSYTILLSELQNQGPVPIMPERTHLNEGHQIPWDIKQVLQRHSLVCNHTLLYLNKHNYHQKLVTVRYAKNCLCLTAKVIKDGEKQSTKKIKNVSFTSRQKIKIIF